MPQPLLSSRRRALSVLALGCALVSTLVSAQDPAVQEGDIYYGCGKPKPIPGYEFSFRGATISLPQYGQILRGVEVLYSAEEISQWEPPYTEARYAVVDDWLLIVTSATDCVDRDDRDLFMIRDNGPLIHQPVWTGNYIDGFFLADGRLTYWSEWFCDPMNKDRENGMSLVYSFSAKDQRFVRDEVDPQQYCPPKPQPRFVEFQELPVTSK